jgi:hypothetical protein
MYNAIIQIKRREQNMLKKIALQTVFTAATVAAAVTDGVTNLARIYGNIYNEEVHRFGKSKVGAVATSASIGTALNVMSMLPGPAILVGFALSEEIFPGTAPSTETIVATMAGLSVAGLTAGNQLMALNGEDQGPCVQKVMQLQNRFS